MRQNAPTMRSALSLTTAPDAMATIGIEELELGVRAYNICQAARHPYLRRSRGNHNRGCE